MWISDIKARGVTTMSLLIVGNAIVWVAALVTFWGHLHLIEFAGVAYLLGLAHALDADHICAIDNVTRKLMQDGQRPVGVGLFFSLGHSTIVVLATILIAATAAAFRSRLDTLHGIGGVIGTLVS